MASRSIPGRFDRRLSGDGPGTSRQWWLDYIRTPKAGDRRMKDVTERIAALSSDKQSMLLERLKQKKGQKAGVTSPASDPLDAWIVRYRPNDQARLRLFCFPYAGGRASVFRSWLDALPADIELCCIQLPGR